jgi:hypothetical protein
MSEALSKVQFSFHPSTHREMGGVPHHTVEVWESEHAGTPWAQAHPAERNRYAGSDLDPGYRPIASMSWHHKTGEILGLHTSPQFQRQGIATGMWHEGQRIASETRGVTKPKHSPVRTESGERWARSLGGRLPRRTEFKASIGEARPA